MLVRPFSSIQPWLLPFGFFGALLLAISPFLEPLGLFSFVPVFKILVSFFLVITFFPLPSSYSRLLSILGLFAVPPSSFPCSRCPLVVLVMIQPFRGGGINGLLELWAVMLLSFPSFVGKEF